MVIFEDDRFTVEVLTISNPADDYVDTLHSMIDVLAAGDDPGNWFDKTALLELLRAMMPNKEQAFKMFKELHEAEEVEKRPRCGEMRCVK